MRENITTRSIKQLKEVTNVGEARRAVINGYLRWCPEGQPILVGKGKEDCQVQPDTAGATREGRASPGEQREMPGRVRGVDHGRGMPRKGEARLSLRGKCDPGPRARRPRLGEPVGTDQPAATAGTERRTDAASAREVVVPGEQHHLRKRPG